MDNCIFYSKKSTTIDNIILSLKNELLLEREEDMAGFLGIDISRNTNNNGLSMPQTGLIERILIAMDMEEHNLKYNPVKNTHCVKICIWYRVLKAGNIDLLLA